MRFGSRSILLAALAAVALGCMSPTLPLPPPSASETQIDATTIELDGTAAPGALVVVVNPNTTYTGQKIAEATFAADDGTWKQTITAAKGDVLTIEQYVGDQTSSTTFQVQ